MAIKKPTTKPIVEKEVKPKTEKVKAEDPSLDGLVSFNTYEGRKGFSYADVGFITCLTMTVMLSGIIIGHGLASRY